MTSVKAVILTYNEARHIAACVESLLWADGVIVLDSFSTDATVPLAQEAGAAVIQHTWTNYAHNRNVALDTVEADWVLFVDADERATADLAAETRRVVAQDDKVGWWIPRHNYIFGHRMRATGWYPDYQMRLLRRGFARYDPGRAVHELVVLDGEAGHLESPLIHYNYDNLGQFLEKQRRYLSYDVGVLVAEGADARIYAPYTVALRHIWWRFVTLKGYRDSVVGTLAERYDGLLRNAQVSRAPTGPAACRQAIHPAPPHPHRMIKRHRLALVALLLVAGAGMLMLSRGRGAPTPALVPRGAPRPSPTWAQMPTRQPAWLQPSGALDMAPFGRALLIGDTDAAQLIWDSLDGSDAGETAQIQLLGARLALQQARYVQAEERTWRAIGLDPASAEAWSLLGVVLRRLGNDASADHALGIAEALDPALAPALFDDRWRAAVALGNAAGLTALAESYVAEHPDSQLAPHYRATALLAAGDPVAAVDLLVAGLRDEPGAPALVWYTLGEAYLAAHGYAEAAVVLESAAGKVARGDTTLTYVTADPITALNQRLARAYLEIGSCREAESIYRRLMVAQPDLAPWVEKAVICQTPTPTLTPWIPRPVTLTPDWQG